MAERRMAVLEGRCHAVERRLAEREAEVSELRQVVIQASQQIASQDCEVQRLVSLQQEQAETIEQQRQRLALLQDPFRQRAVAEEADFVIGSSLVEPAGGCGDTLSSLRQRLYDRVVANQQLRLGSSTGCDRTFGPSSAAVAHCGDAAGGGGIQTSRTTRCAAFNISSPPPGRQCNGTATPTDAVTVPDPELAWRDVT